MSQYLSTNQRYEVNKVAGRGAEQVLKWTVIGIIQATKFFINFIKSMFSMASGK